jgi:primosomal protein N' (replication factor Y)
MTLSSANIDVAIALPVYNTFTYSVPENLAALVSVGKRVLVPFGRRRVTGYILGDSQDNYHKDLKAILDVLDEKPLFPASMIPFFKWVADYYLHPIGDVIKTALPGGLNLYDFVTLAVTKKGEQILYADKKAATPLENEILNLLKIKPLRRKDLGRTLKQDVSNALIYDLERRGLIVGKRKLKGQTVKAKMERYVALPGSDVAFKKLSGAGKKIMAAVKDEGEISVQKLKALVPSAPRIIHSLEKSGYIKILQKKVYRDPFGEPIRSDTTHILTGEQQHAVSKVLGLLGQGFATCLLTGVTGSGKTEVYLHLAAEAVQRGLCVLVLVPEIALISQMERRFRARFGECVAVLHSGLSAGERYDQWLRIARQEVTIAIGARSAIFAPFADIGIIIVDEEHDTSYKQDSGLRYNARDLAVVRAKLHNCVALLGSATPSIQSYYNVTKTKFTQVTLKERVEQRPMPEITVVDLRKYRDTRGIRRFITPRLHTAIKETLEHNKQVLLFLNRRGFASYPVCGACGEAIRCKNCDISLTLHQGARAYKCHYCGFTLAAASNCLSCGSNKIRLLGLGTEKVEAAVKALFPDARVARMDRDTTVRKGSILKILKGLRNQTIDILVGTQMVAKGHDFPNITLVGIICADLSLNFPDFRAGERTFQLLAQVSGRAGRGKVPGRVILQTYNPDHFSILSATDQDFEKFYNQEIHFRKSLNYPPFARMVQLKISGKNKEKTRQHALAIGDLCHALLKNDATFLKYVQVLGPIEAALPRVAKHFRWQILLKGLKVGPLHRFLQQILFENRAKISSRSIKVIADVDPFFMM